MKKLVLLLALQLLALSAYSQYTMQTTMEPYQHLISPTSLNNGAVWNEGTNYQIYFNFNFDLYGQTYTALNVLAGGGVAFPGLGTKELLVYHTPFGGYLLRDRGTGTSLSSIGYEISGTPGQRLLKIEWRSAGFVQWYPTSDPTDFVDFQIWLFESDHHIEVHFGNHQTDPGTYLRLSRCHQRPQSRSECEVLV